MKADCSWLISGELLIRGLSFSRLTSFLLCMSHGLTIFLLCMSHGEWEKKRFATTTFFYRPPQLKNDHSICLFLGLTVSLDSSSAHTALYLISHFKSAIYG